MRKILTLLLIFPFAILYGQNGEIKGNVSSSDTGNGIVGVEITLQPTGQSTITDVEGNYMFSNLTAGEYVVQIGSNNVSRQLEASLLTNNERVDLGTYNGNADALSGKVTLLSGLEIENEEDESVSSILTASRDVFLNKAGFQFGSDTYFRVRGYDSRYGAMLVNGLRMENPETGWQQFSVVGGLNDVLRYRDDETIGNAAAENTFGEIGGVRDYVLRPSAYRKGGRITYSNLNRSYNNRAMAMYASGDQNGISYVLSGSHRWAQEGNIEGTYYDSYAMYAAVEGRVSPKYSVSTSFMMSPRRRATQGIHTQEVYDLAGSNYYNADWGYQNGEQRSGRLRDNDNPILMVNNYIDISPSTEATVTGGYMTGNYIYSRIERASFQDVNGQFRFAVNPDPDYYQKLPSYEGFSSRDPDFLAEQQLAWHDFYRVNSRVPDGRAQYMLEDNTRDDKEYQAVAHLTTTVNNDLTLNYGANFRRYNGNFYKKVNDLFGADHWLDVDSFNGDIPHELNDTNTKVGTNSIFGMDYDLNKRTYDAFVQGQYSLPKFDIHVGGMVGRSEVWREGNFATSKHPTNSLGDSETAEFDLYGGKAGATYKIDGRNYVSVNGMYYTKAPDLRAIFIEPDVRNHVNEDVIAETIYSGEANFVHNSPGLKMRLSGYYTQFQDQSENILAFSEGLDGAGAGGFDDAGLASFVMTGIDKRHYGGELGFAANIMPTIEVSGAAAMGKYTYTDRPTLTAYDDINEGPVLAPRTVFLDRFYEDNTPQSAYNLGVTYRAPFFMFANLDANYYKDAYAGPSALRRTYDIANRLDPRKTIDEWTEQENLAEAFRLNLSLYKSFRLSEKYFLGINLIAQNLLDEDDYTNLAFEQLRVQENSAGHLDADLFPTRYRYALGRTYFVNAVIRFR